MLSLSYFMVGILFLSLLLASETPLGYLGWLLALSIWLVLLMVNFWNNWMGYVLFLIYIGGLLVLFMYIVLTSSNYTLYFNWNYFLLMSSFSSFLFCSLISFPSLPVESVSHYSSYFGEGLSVVLILGLGIYLLATFLSLVRIMFRGGVCIKIESP